jgi:hypothetical protein
VLASFSNHGRRPKAETGRQSPRKPRSATPSPDDRPDPIEAVSGLMTYLQNSKLAVLSRDSKPVVANDAKGSGQLVEPCKQQFGNLGFNAQSEDSRKTGSTDLAMSFACLRSLTGMEAFRNKP